LSARSGPKEAALFLSQALTVDSTVAEYFLRLGLRDHYFFPCRLAPELTMRPKPRRLFFRPRGFAFAPAETFLPNP
jgi:hypothetical protein